MEEQNSKPKKKSPTKAKTEKRVVHKRANSKERRPSKSKVKEIEELDLLTDPMTLEIQSQTPVAFVKDPDQEVPVERIPEHLRDAIIQNYGEEFLREKTWTLRILKKLNMAIGNPRENVNNTLAQICGPNCQYKDTCPHDIVGRAPVGERCPQERGLIKLLYHEYMVAVSDRLHSDVEELKHDIISHNLVMGLVEADITSMRLDGSIAKDGFISEVPTVVNEDTGEVHYREEEAVAVRIKERVYKRRDQIYRQLLATPEMAEKYKKRDTQDALAKTANLVERLEGLVGKVEQRQITDAEVVDEVPEGHSKTGEH